MGLFGPSKKQKLASGPISPPARNARYLRQAVGSIPDYDDVATDSIRRAGVDPGSVDYPVLSAAIGIVARSQLGEWARRSPGLGADLDIVMNRPDFSAQLLADFLLGQESATAVAIHNRYAEIMCNQIPEEFASTLRQGQYLNS